MNPLGIDQPCLKIAKYELLFEKYRIALKRDKDAIDIYGNDAIDSHQLVLDFMLRMFDNLNQLYEMEKSLLIDAILKYHLRNEIDEENLSETSSSTKESAKENISMPSPSRKDSVEENTSKPSPSRKESAKENTSNPSTSSKESVEKNTSKPSTSRKESAKENTSKPSPTKGFFEDKTKRTCQANSNSYNTDLNAKKGACNEARSSWEEHVGMHDNMRKGDFEHSHEESNGNSSDEEEDQLPMSGRKVDDENLKEKEKKR